MSHFKSTPDRYCHHFSVYRTILVALAILPVGCKEEQQADKAPTEQASVAQNVPQPAAQPAPAAPTQPIPVAATPTPLTDLESLVAPIALYPDPLLAELLVASTYPLEVVQAARWLETKPDLATLNSKDWDASVMRLTSVPTVIKMMNDHLDWTTQLGDAFLAKPVELMDVIQQLRKRAKDSGFLKDTPEQKVSTQTVSLDQPAESDTAKVIPAVLKKDVISIAPAKSDMVYVPQYNPETVYQAPMATPPAGTVVNVNQATPTSGYYPTYYPAPTTTTSTSDSLLTFGAGALVGGLLTWGIMEWADDDDWDDYHHVGHYYGDSVCHNGNCWSGGGGYYGDRGNVNYNKNVNISGNEVNIDRGQNFNQNNLKPSQRPAGWQPNPKHRRGQAYPKDVQKRLGASQQPALAGQRLGAAQTLPASARGLAEAGQRPAAGRPSSADIRQQLTQKPGAENKLGSKLKPNSPSTRDIQNQLEQGARGNALQGIKNPGKVSQLESQRGSNSRASALRENQAIKAIDKGGQNKRPNAPAVNKQPQLNQMPKIAERSQGAAGRGLADQQRTAQRRSESARPNAFEAPRNAGSANKFSNRGAASIQRSAGGGNQRPAGGGNKQRAAGGGGGKRAGGGGGRGR